MTKWTSRQYALRDKRMREKIRWSSRTYVTKLYFEVAKLQIVPNMRWSRTYLSRTSDASSKIKQNQFLWIQLRIQKITLVSCLGWIPRICWSFLGLDILFLTYSNETIHQEIRKMLKLFLIFLNFNDFSTFVRFFVLNFKWVKTASYDNSPTPY